ncbi:MAG: WecB/TagA/CpsF family glycosyltransferase [Clostridia bacterium]
MKKDIMGILIDDVTKEQALERLSSYLASPGKMTVFTPNSEICMMALRNRELMEILNRGSLVLPDGQGVVLASKILKSPLREKVGGCDLFLSFFRICSPVRVFLLGGKPETSERAGQALERDYPNVTVTGTMHGYFPPEALPDVLRAINASGSHLLLVGFGAPKQEEWIHRNLPSLDVRVAAGVGGTLDILAGTARMAPAIFVRLGLEWFYRLLKQPRRLKRMLKIPLFLFLCLRRRFRK